VAARQNGDREQTNDAALADDSIADRGFERSHALPPRIQRIVLRPGSSIHAGFRIVLP
jgi:hypothetical protein